MRGVRISGLALSWVAPFMWIMAWSSALEPAPEGMATFSAAFTGWTMSIVGAVLLIVSLFGEAPAAMSRRRGQVATAARWSAVALAAVSSGAMLALPALLVTPGHAWLFRIPVFGAAALVAAAILSLAVPLPPPRPPQYYR